MGDKKMSPKYLAKDVYLSVRALLLNLFVHSRPVTTTDPDNIRSILVIRIDRIGDVVISLPAIRALQVVFPNAKISVLANRSCAPLLQGVPYVSEIITYAGFRRSIVCLREKKFDMAVDLLMDYSIKTATIAFLSGAPVRAGFDIESRGRFFNIPVTPDRKEKQMSEHALDISRAIGRTYKTEGLTEWDPQPRLKISEDAMAHAENILNRSGINKEDRAIGIHPGGYYPSQCWMPEAFAELADKTAEKHNVKIVIIGSAAERKLVEGIVSMMKIKPAFIVGESIEVVAGVISALDLLICNNSGPLHIACALSTPTVSTMGPTVPHLWWPLGTENTVVRHNLPCSPCSAGCCADHECMRQISVQEMEDAVARQLEKPLAHKRSSAGTDLRKEYLDNILVINLGGIGDVILSTPALCALKNTYPRARVYFLGVKRVNEFVQHLPYVDEVVNFDFSVSPGSVINNIRTLAYLKNLKMSLAINMRTLVSRSSALKIMLLLKMIGAKVTVGRDTEGRGDFFDIRIPESWKGDKSEMEYDLDAVRALGGEIVNKQPDLVIDDASLKRVGSILSSNGISAQDILIGVHPGGKESHRWPAEKFAEAVNLISDKVSAKFIMTGDKADAAAAEKVIKLSKVKVIDAIGKLSLGESGALIKRCNLYICNDTSVMHIAAILKVPLIAIFGPGYLKRVDPRNISKDAVVIYRETSCAPCDRKTCGKMECLKNIETAEVVRAALRLLKPI